MVKTNSNENPIVLNPIGVVKGIEQEQKFWIEIHKEFRPALKELEHFTHMHVIWWANKNDTPKLRKVLVSEELPPFYGKDAPSMGVFSNRSEFRPNPVLMTICPILSIDIEQGIITVPWMDAFPETPVIDIKPYLPMADLVETADYPEYLQHWPKSVESAMKWWAEMENQ